MEPYILISAGCSNDCIFCIDSKEFNSKIDEKLLKDSLYWIKRKPEGIILSGADPGEYDKIDSYLLWLSERIEKIKICTNGMNFEKKELINSILSIRKKLLFRIPLYGSEAKIHDTITKNPGSFEKTCSALRMLKQNGFEILVSIMFLKQNEDDVYEIAEKAKEYSDQITIGLPLHLEGSDDYEYYKPDLSTVIKTLNSTLANLEFTHINLEFIPPCLVEKELLKKNIGFATKEPKEKVKGDNIKNQNLVRIPACSSCQHKDVCDGIIKDFREELALSWTRREQI